MGGTDITLTMSNSSWMFSPRPFLHLPSLLRAVNGHLRLVLTTRLFLLPVRRILVPMVQLLRNVRWRRHHPSLLLLHAYSLTYPQLNVSIFIISKLSIVPWRDVVVSVLAPSLEHAFMVPRTARQCKGRAYDIGKDIVGIEQAVIGKDSLHDLRTNR